MLTKIYDVLLNETTICTTTTKTTTLASEAIHNRTKFITPSWKKSSKFFYKDYRGSRMGMNNSSASNNQKISKFFFDIAILYTAFILLKFNF